VVVWLPLLFVLVVLSPLSAQAFVTAAKNSPLAAAASSSSSVNHINNKKNYLLHHHRPKHPWPLFASTAARNGNVHSQTSSSSQAASPSSPSSRNTNESSLQHYSSSSSSSTTSSSSPLVFSRLAALFSPQHAFSTLSSSSSTRNNNSDYQRRKNEWARKYTSVDALRETFGANVNKVWGDLDAPTARRLYKTLLPKALLDLYKLGVEPQDLAPLAYRARVAAKLYARERCQVPARWLAHWYDGFRQWRTYGSFDTTGMSYQQVWEKYATVILNECSSNHQKGVVVSEQDVTAMICCKILEKSCTTNEMVDRLVLSHTNKNRADQADLQHFTDTLEKDVRMLLQLEDQYQKQYESDKKQLSVKRFKMLRKIVKLKRRMANTTNNNKRTADAAKAASEVDELVAATTLQRGGGNQKR
jgi:hypothetical protein